MCYALQYIDVGKYEEVPKPMPKEQIIMLKAITDESRLRIIKLLEQGEQCACVLLENLHFSQPCEAGLVNSRKEGRWVYYSLNQANGRELARFIKELFQVTNTGDDHHACC